jgi:hypothetical protein
MATIPDAYVQRAIAFTGELTSSPDQRMTIMALALVILAKRCFVEKDTALENLASIWDEVELRGPIQ